MYSLHHTHASHWKLFPIWTRSYDESKASIQEASIKLSLGHCSLGWAVQYALERPLNIAVDNWIELWQHTTFKWWLTVHGKISFMYLVWRHWASSLQSLALLACQLQVSKVSAAPNEEFTWLETVAYWRYELFPVVSNKCWSISCVWPRNNRVSTLCNRLQISLPMDRLIINLYY